MSHRFLDACRRRPVEGRDLAHAPGGRYLPSTAPSAPRCPSSSSARPRSGRGMTLQPVDILASTRPPLQRHPRVCEAMGHAVSSRTRGPQFPRRCATQADGRPTPRRGARRSSDSVDGSDPPGPERTRRPRAADRLLRGPWTLAAYMIEGKTSRSFERAKPSLLRERLAHAAARQDRRLARRVPDTRSSRRARTRCRSSILERRFSAGGLPRNLARRTSRA